MVAASLELAPGPRAAPFARPAAAARASPAPVPAEPAEAPGVPVIAEELVATALQTLGARLQVAAMGLLALYLVVAWIAGNQAAGDAERELFLASTPSEHLAPAPVSLVAPVLLALVAPRLLRLRRFGPDGLSGDALHVFELQRSQVAGPRRLYRRKGYALALTVLGLAGALMMWPTRRARNVRIDADGHVLAPRPG